MWTDEPQRTASHDSICIMPKGELRRELIACLRRAKAKRVLRTQAEDRRGKLPDLLSIYVRLLEACDRAFLGPLTDDLKKDAGKRSAVGVVERNSPLTTMKLADSTAASVLGGFTTEQRNIAHAKRQTWTYDHGKEMARHAELTANTDVKVCFCALQSPWQRGSRRKTNGLVNQFLSRDTDLSDHGQQELGAIADLFNNRSRPVNSF